jgi:outer membrane protein
LAASWRGAAGQLDLGVKGGATSTSKGHEANITYSNPIQQGGEVAMLFYIANCVSYS